MKFIYILMILGLLSHIPARATAQTACMQTFSQIRKTVGQMRLKANRKVEAEYRNQQNQQNSLSDTFMFPAVIIPGFSFITATMVNLQFEIGMPSAISLGFGIGGALFAYLFYGEHLEKQDVKQGISKMVWLDVLENLGLSEKELTEVANSNALRRVRSLPELTEEFLLRYEELLLNHYAEHLHSLNSVLAKDFLSQREKDFIKSLEEEVSSFFESQQNRTTRSRRTPSKSKQYDPVIKQNFEETQQQIFSELQKEGLSEAEARIIISEALRSRSHIIRSYAQFVSEKVGFSKEETQKFAQIIESYLNSEKPEDLVGMELAVN